MLIYERQFLENIWRITAKKYVITKPLNLHTALSSTCKTPAPLFIPRGNAPYSHRSHYRTVFPSIRRATRVIINAFVCPLSSLTHISSFCPYFPIHYSVIKTLIPPAVLTFCSCSSRGPLHCFSSSHST